MLSAEPCMIKSQPCNQGLFSLDHLKNGVRQHHRSGLELPASVPYAADLHLINNTNRVEGMQEDIFIQVRPISTSPPMKFHVQSLYIVTTSSSLVDTGTLCAFSLAPWIAFTSISCLPPSSSIFSFRRLSATTRMH